MDNNENKNQNETEENDLRQEPGDVEVKEEQGSSPEPEKPEVPKGMPGTYPPPPPPYYPEKADKAWYKKPCVTIPEGYNPYRDDMSVFSEVYAENKEAFRGPDPIEGEMPEQYLSRKRYEWDFARTKAKKKLRSSANRMSFALIMYIGMIYGIVYFVSDVLALTQTTGVDIDLLNNVLQIMTYVLIMPAIFVWFNVGKKHKVLTLYQKPQVSGLFIFRWCIIALGGTYAISLVFNILFNILKALGLHVNDLNSPLPETAGEMIFYFLTVAVGAPIFEEILFRGVLLTDHMKYGCWHAAIVTGVMFGLLHMNHQQMFYAMALGVVFAVIDIKAGSIIPSIIAHFSVNFFSFLSALFMSFTNYNELMGSEEALMSDLDGPVWALFGTKLMDSLVYVLIAAGLILFVCEIAINGKKYPMPRGDSGLTQGEKASAFWFAPVTIVALLILLGFTAVNSFIPPDFFEEIMSSISM